MAFTKLTKSVLNISALPDRVENQAQVLKATFDQAGVDIKEAHNVLITELEADTSAESLGAKNPNGETSTVQSELDNLYTSMTGKIDKAEGKQLSTEDFTTEEKTKLAGIAEGANNYVLPEASTTTLGGIKVDGSTIVVENGVAKAKAADSADYIARAEIEELKNETEVKVSELQTSINDIAPLIGNVETSVNKMEGDLYSQDRYNEVVVEKETIPVDYITPVVLSEELKNEDCIPKTWTASGSNSYVSENGTTITCTQTGDIYLAFDGSTSTHFNSTGSSGEIVIEFTKPLKILKMNLKVYSTNAMSNTHIYIYGSNDNSNYKQLYYQKAGISSLTEVTLSNTNYYKYYKVYVAGDGAGTYADFYEIQATSYYEAIWGLEVYTLKSNSPLASYEKGKIVNIEGGRYTGPTTLVQEDIIPKSWTQVTANTEYISANGTKLKASNSLSSTYPVSNACDGNIDTYWSTTKSEESWMQIEFPSAKHITKMKIYCVGSGSDINIKIQGGNDGADWIDLYVATEYIDPMTEVTLSNTDFYKFYRLIYEHTSPAYDSTYEWQVSEYLNATDFVTTFYNPLININNLGNKQINGPINYGEKYSLVYNGESWDVVNTKVITGSFICATSLKTINLGFTPDLVICYCDANNTKGVGEGNTNTARYNAIPRILSKAHFSVDVNNKSNGQIVDGGFDYIASSNDITIYYIAIKF